MEKTPSGTSVGVEDPYDHVDRCDHCTDEGRCRFAVEQGERDPEFADARSREEFRCPVVGALDEEGLTGPWAWADCPHFRCRNHERECVRCGLDEPNAFTEARGSAFALSAARRPSRTPPQTPSATC